MLLQNYKGHRLYFSVPVTIQHSTHCTHFTAKSHRQSSQIYTVSQLK